MPDVTQTMNGHVQLLENDLPKFCPFQMPLGAQTKLGQPIPLFKGCGTWCALFRLQNNSQSGMMGEQVELNPTAHLSCTGKEIVIQISPAPETAAPGLKLV